MTISGSPVRKVVAYIWHASEDAPLYGVGDDGLLSVEHTSELRVEALFYWPLEPGFCIEKGIRYCAINDAARVYAKGEPRCRKPDLEELACGHRLPVREGRLMGGGFGKYYRRGRRCSLCGMEALST